MKPGFAQLSANKSALGDKEILERPLALNLERGKK